MAGRKVVIISMQYPPDFGGAANRARNLVAAFRLLGHEVVTVSEFPNHPAGVVHPGYGGRLFRTIKVDGVTSIRTYVRPNREKSFRDRMVFYGTFAASAAAASLRIRGAGFVIATSPPLTTGIPGMAAGAWHDVPMALDVQDLWPDQAIDVGMLTGARAIRAARALEQWLYSRADSVMAVTHGYCKRIAERGVPATKVTWVPNTSDTSVFRPVDGSAFRRRFGLEGKFVVLYAGTFGVSQGLGIVIEAAMHTRGEKNIVYVLLGAGPMKRKMEGEIEAEALENVRILDPIPVADMPSAYCAADMNLVALRSSEYFMTTVPSKLYDILSCAAPVVLTVGGESAEILEAAGGGAIVPAGDGRALGELALEWMKTGSPRPARGPEYVKRRFSVEALAERLNCALRDFLPKTQRSSDGQSS